MHFNDSIIQAYLQERPISKEKLYHMIKLYHTPSHKRHEVVHELNQQVKSIVDNFPVFNTNLWNMLFHEKDELLDSITICPIVGGEQLCEKVSNHGKTYLLVDLICVADITSIVSQMVYVLKNQITYEITKLCILNKYPLNSQNYMSLLNASAFVNGLSHYIAWNESCANYQFYSAKYEPRKENAFGLLSQAMHIDNKAMQHKILLHIRGGDLWDQFPAAAGMFYFDDIYREFKEKGICDLFTQGPKDFIKHIYE